MHVLIIGRSEDFEIPIEQSLADFGVDWQVQFAADAASALGLVQRTPPDVVVCELRPLGMDGNALLERIRSRAPQAARIMLLEETDAGKASAALGHAHRLLNKPLRVAELVEAVDSIADLRDLLDSPELKAVLGKIDRLPPPPKLYLALSHAVNDRDTSLSKLADLVAQDPSTAARVMRICNSAYYSNGRAISDVRKAVIRLGQQELRRIVLASEAFRASPSGIDLEAMRQRSLVASQIAGRIVDNANSELATTAALLSEVGMLLPGVALPDAHGRLHGDGPSFAEAGAYLLGMWGLPMPIVEAVAHHYHPQRTRNRGFWIGAAVHVACALAAGRPPNEAFLASIGVADRLPQWRKLAAELGARMQAAESAENADAETEPAVAASPASAEDRRRAASELLDSQQSTQLECHGVHYLLIGNTLGGSAHLQLVDAACLLHPFEALAVGLCPARLESPRASYPPASLLDALRRAGATRLGRWAYAQTCARIEKHLGTHPYEAVMAAIEGAHRRKLPVWPIDADIDLTLGRVVEQLGLRQRLALWWQTRRARSGASATGALALAALADGDPVAMAFIEVDAGHAGIRRSLFAERELHMARRLRAETRRSGARRVLVVAAARHLAGLKRALREAD